MADQPPNADSTDGNEPRTLDATAPEAQMLNLNLDVSLRMRGTFIDQAIWIDLIVTDLVARYFVEDRAKRSLFFSDVISGPDSSFSGRIAILKKAVLRSYQDFLDQQPRIFDQLDKIRRFRNRLAHSSVNYRKGGPTVDGGHRVVLEFHEDGEQKSQIVTAIEFRARLAECTEVIRSLAALQQRLPE